MNQHYDASSAKEEHYELFVQCFARHEADLRRFIGSLLPTWSDVDEVLQQTALVIWRKFDQYDPETPFMKWACVIARFEVLGYRRKMARDRLVFREELLDLMAEEGADELDTQRAEFDALEACLSELPAAQRQLLTLAYTPGVKVKELAEKAGNSAASFYMRLKRLRHRMMTCMESKMHSQESPS